MQIPKRALVGRRNGKRVINWPAVLLLGVIVGVVSGAAGGATWFLLTKKFSLFAVLFPVVPVGFWVSRFVSVLQCRLSSFRVSTQRENDCGNAAEQACWSGCRFRRSVRVRTPSARHHSARALGDSGM